MTPEPVQTQYGWHVIQLEDTRDAAPPPFDQVKAQLTNGAIRKKLQAYVADLKKDAKIERKPDALGSAAPPSAAAPGVAAPPGTTDSAAPSAPATPQRRPLQPAPRATASPDPLHPAGARKVPPDDAVSARPPQPSAPSGLRTHQPFFKSSANPASSSTSTPSS